jgi:hypothetical protein
MDPRRDRTDTFVRGLIAGSLVGAVIAGSSAWGRRRIGTPVPEADIGSNRRDAPAAPPTGVPPGLDPGSPGA